MEILEITLEHFSSTKVSKSDLQGLFQTLLQYRIASSKSTPSCISCKKTNLGKQLEIYPPGATSGVATEYKNEPIKPKATTQYAALIIKLVTALRWNKPLAISSSAAGKPME